jgi:hypothetical protein
MIVRIQATKNDMSNPVHALLQIFRLAAGGLPAADFPAGVGGASVCRSSGQLSAGFRLQIFRSAVGGFPSADL